jgi:hypothetical protein
VEWKCSEQQALSAEDTGAGFTSGLPVVVVSCPDTGLDFGHMVEYLEQELGPDTYVWISMLGQFIEKQMYFSVSCTQFVIWLQLAINTPYKTET